MWRGWGSDSRFGDDLCGAGGIAVELAIRLLIRPKRRALKGDPAKYTSCAAIAQNLRTHVSIRVSRSRTSLRSGSRRYVSAKLHLGMQEATRAAVVHDQKNEVRCFSANPQTKAAAFQRIHGRSTPRAREVLTGAAHHRAAAVAAPNNKRRFQHRRHDHHTAGLVNKVLRDVIRNIEDLLHHFSSILKTVLLSFCFALIFCKHDWS